MNLPKVNGKIDTEIVADMIVTHILSQSITKHYSTRLPSEEKKELEKYVKEILDNIDKEE